MGLLDPDSDISIGLRVDKNATAALPQVIAACAGDTCDHGETRPEMFARKAYAIATAMERQRTKEIER